MLSKIPSGASFATSSVGFKSAIPGERVLVHHQASSVFKNKEVLRAFDWLLYFWGPTP
jgi:hypothetical protein